MDNAFVTARLVSPHFDCSRMQVRSVNGREAISQPYRFEVEVLFPDPGELIESEVLGADATIVFEKDGLELRSIHGMVAEIDDLLESEAAFRSYRLEIVPHAYRMSVVETQEVFLDLTVADIVRSKLQLVGLGARDVDMRLSGEYSQREFVVQYRETDLAFVSRLTEHLGMSYYFEQAGDSEKIVFCDSAGAFRPIDGDDKVPFRPRGDKRDVYRLEKHARMIPATYVVQDYNYRTPRVDLTSSYESPAGNAGGVVEYGAHQKNPAEGLALAKARAEEREARFHYFVGESDVCRFRAGATFELTDHPRLPNQRLLLVEVEHHLVQSVLTAATGQEHTYRVSFKAVDALKNYRPPRVTPKPRIAGVLTATVEAESRGAGRVARIDEHGRYLVAFHFDTGSSSRKRSSRPLRMMQPHAGPNHGMHFPLKPDTEVLITFVDGDPDRPIIAGAVPNPVTASPVNRANATMHTISTASGIHFIMNDTP